MTEIIASLQSGVTGLTEETFLEFVDWCNELFENDGLSPDFHIKEIRWFPKGSHPSFDTYKNNLLSCDANWEIRNGGGGYFGEPWCRVSMDLDDGYLLNGNSRTTVCHEWGHYFGACDYYWLNSKDDVSPVVTEIRNTLMMYPYYCYHFDIFSNNVIRYNINQLKNGNHTSIKMPWDRWPKSFKVNMGVPNTQYKITHGTRDFTYFHTVIPTTPSFYRNTDEYGYLSFNILNDFGELYFDLFKIASMDDSYVTWVNNLATEKCFLYNNVQPTTCIIDGRNRNGQYCYDISTVPTPIPTHTPTPTSTKTPTPTVYPTWTPTPTPSTTTTPTTTRTPTPTSTPTKTPTVTPTPLYYITFNSSPLNANIKLIS